MRNKKTIIFPKTPICSKLDKNTFAIDIKIERILPTKIRVSCIVLILLTIYLYNANIDNYFL